MAVTQDTKVKIEVGALEYTISEVERLRRDNELLGVENRVMHSFFKLIDAVVPQKAVGYGEDKLWMAKKSLRVAIEEYEKSQLPQAAP